MEDIIIACDNLKDEIIYICNDLILELDIVYIESKLHNTPKLLNKKIQEEIDKHQNVESIILLFGLCGNALGGLKSRNTKIICPKVDDCISLYLGGIEKRRKAKDSQSTYFFTKRYLENESSIYNEMKKIKLKHGEEKTKKMYRALFEKYKYIKTINTGTYDVDDIVDKIEELCNVFELEYESIECDLSLFYKILNKDFDENFIILNKEQELKIEHFEII